MNEENPKAAATVVEDKGDTAQLIYILYLASLLLGITAIVGVVMAYMNKAKAPEWVQSHYIYLIHTFWKGLLYSVVGLITMMVLIGFLIIPLVIVWWIVRCVKGLQALNKQQPIEDPTGWVF